MRETCTSGSVRAPGSNPGLLDQPLWLKTDVVNIDDALGDPLRYRVSLRHHALAPRGCAGTALPPRAPFNRALAACHAALVARRLAGEVYGLTVTAGGNALLRCPRISNSST